jgi:hypothetical protein
MLFLTVISFLLFSGAILPEAQGNTVEMKESGLVFRWDKSNYEDNYLNNAQAAQKLCNFLEEIGYENIDSVSVKAYASPEGLYEHNMMLSRKRAQEFDRAIKAKLGLDRPDLPVHVRPGGEAWDLLRDRIVADTVMSAVARQRVLDQLDNKKISVNERKWGFMHGSLGDTRQEGDVYHYILLHHYVYLRCLSVKIYLKDGVGEVGNDVAAPVDTDVAVPADTTTVIPGYDRESQNVQSEIAEQVGNDVMEEPADTTASVIPADTTSVIPASEPESQAFAPESSTKSRRTGTPVIGISTNLPYDITYLPNYGLTSIPSFSLEYYPRRGHWTFGADLELSHWLHPEEHRYNQIHNLTLWTRRYFKDGENGFKGLYLLGNVNGAMYGLGWNEKGWEGEGLGASLGIGHKWKWNRFFIDAGIAAGVFYSRYDPYTWGADATGWYYYDYAGDPAKFTPRNKALVWFGPTRVYISVGFDLFKRKK